MTGNCWEWELFMVYGCPLYYVSALWASSIWLRQTKGNCYLAIHLSSNPSVWLALLVEVK